MAAAGRVWAAGSILDDVVAALYRRYRPETFAELIGQSQVTDPLRTALRTDRVNHAYLFSGPRGCGKTTSARILARCLNCAEGPTDTPCGKCASCIELARDGSGSLDVVEIDAASHNGVDDARDLRERAVFAPARDRYKIFILDEAHMVTPQGFNALLKIVEEPPEHVKFIFATTEPEKVIGTIRSRTHHYPFRLVPPAQMLEYVQTLCEAEGITVAPGVLPLVVRAGGGSVRDTLSLLDQLMAGSEGTNIEYERAVALLGYTHGALLDEVIDAIGARDAAAAFTSVDRVIQTGQDPRRFVEDLLERLRDLIIVAATMDGAAAVLRGIPQDELERMGSQAHKFGTAELSRAADVVNTALTEMTGATSPRLHLELMVARVLVPASDETDRGALARVERLERRIGVDGPTPAPVVAAAAPRTPVVEKVPEQNPPVAESPGSSAPVTLQQVRDSWPEILDVVQKEKRSAWMVVFTSQARALRDDILTLTFPSETDVANFKQPMPGGESVSELLRRAILHVLGLRVKFIAKVEVTAATPAAEPAVAPASVPVAPAAVSPVASAPVPTPAPASVPAPASASVSATAPAVAPAAVPASATVVIEEPPEPTEPDVEPEPVVEAAAVPAEPDLPAAPAKDAAGWAVAPIPASSGTEPVPAKAQPRGAAEPRATAEKPTRERAASEPKVAATSAPTGARAPRAKAADPGNQRYGESVVREILGASFIEEQKIAPRVAPQPKGD
ncbi:MAG: polymerase subunit gamma and tau [Glaciihabitans sp.]|nr:polymerase subunit gamma and tau [Glaciihabitans sp.]